LLLISADTHGYQGEQEHKRIKRFYVRSNKSRTMTSISRQQERERHLHQIHGQDERNQQLDEQGICRKGKAVPLPDDSEPLPYTDPKDHYHMAKSTKNTVRINQWLRQNEGDPAFDVRNIVILIYLYINANCTIQRISSSNSRTT
jgi:hypothetical protein